MKIKTIEDLRKYEIYVSNQENITEIVEIFKKFDEEVYTSFIPRWQNYLVCSFSEYWGFHLSYQDEPNQLSFEEFKKITTNILRKEKIKKLI